jgi:hypothetical protein
MACLKPLLMARDGLSVAGRIENKSQMIILKGPFFSAS